MSDQIAAQSYVVSNNFLFIFRLVLTIFYFGYITWRASIFGLYYWGWTINLIYFAVATVYAKTGKCQKFVEYMQPYVMTEGWMVSVGFWLLLSSAIGDTTRKLSDRIDMIIGHTMNLIPLIIDLFLVKTRPPFWYVVFPVAHAILYAIMLIIVRNVQPTFPWPYGFVDAINGGKDGVNYVMIAGVLLPITALVRLLFALPFYGLSYLRDRCYKVNNSDQIHPIDPEKQ